MFERVAYDIGPANLPLNELMRKHLNVDFDKDGIRASKGELSEDLLKALNELDYYKQKHPKSLGVEWLNRHFYPILEQFSSLSLEDKLRTIVEHETDVIAQELKNHFIKSCLVTGGGALNKFFIKQLKVKTSTEILIPDKQIVEFKEALVFAFLAFLNFNNQVNTLSSVTGAKSDSIGGKRYTPLR